MPRLTRHACIRYLIRSPVLSGQRLSLPRAERIARVSLERSRYATRDEVVDRVGKVRFSSWNTYYRIDEEGGGVWISTWHRGEEVVLTYLHPRTRLRITRERKYEPLPVSRTLGRRLRPDACAHLSACN